MVRAISAFMDFCYLVRRSTISEDTLVAIDGTLARFHHEHSIFLDTGVRDDFNLPRQHSLLHYRHLIQQFGAPNGLCSSITENKHIKAVKEPWRRSNWHKALGQMLIVNQRLDKLAAARVNFIAQGLLPPPPRPKPLPTPCDHDADIADGPKCIGEVCLSTSEGEPPEPSQCLLFMYLAVRNLPHNVGDLGEAIGHPNLQELLRRFLYDQLNPEAVVRGSDVNLDLCPELTSNIHVFHSAVATFYAPSDLSGVGGMRREYIRATPSWFNGPARYDCVVVEHDPAQEGFRGLFVVRVFYLLSFTHEEKQYPCAFVQWFSHIGDQPCDKTGMWRVEPDSVLPNAIIHLDTILRGVHLIGIAGNAFLPKDLQYHESLDAFLSFYVNKFADHHAHEILS